MAWGGFFCGDRHEQKGCEYFTKQSMDHVTFLEMCIPRFDADSTTVSQIHQDVYTNLKAWVFLSHLLDFLDVCTYISFGHERLYMKMGLAE